MQPWHVDVQLLMYTWDTYNPSIYSIFCVPSMHWPFHGYGSEHTSVLVDIYRYFWIKGRRPKGWVWTGTHFHLNWSPYDQLQTYCLEILICLQNAFHCSFLYFRGLLAVSSILVRNNVFPLSLMLTFCFKRKEIILWTFFFFMRVASCFQGVICSGALSSVQLL